MNLALDDKAQAAWSRIIPFLRPIEGLIRDPEISDIMVNGDRAVFFERNGRLEHLPGVIVSEKFLQVAARNIARALGQEISEEYPILDSRLPDGSRVAIVLSPVSVGGTALTIRKFQNQRHGPEDLVVLGMLTDDLLSKLRQAVLDRQNILLSGGTGTGKTTLLNALGSFIQDDERLVVIEDTSELQINKPNVVRFEARSQQPDRQAVGIRELFRAALRQRPDRILLGEVRGAEAFDLLQAMNTGHQGTLSTIHANSARETLTRFATCVMMSGVELPYRTVQANIADAVHLVVHIARRDGRRFVSEVLEVRGYDAFQNVYELQDVYVRNKETP